MQLPSFSDCVVTIDRLAPVLLDMAVRSVVVLALVSVATLAMRRASAAARHWVWLLGFAGLLLLPALLAMLPGWRILPRVESKPVVARTLAVAGSTAPLGDVVGNQRVVTEIQNKSPTISQPSAPAAAQTAMPSLSSPRPATIPPLERTNTVPLTCWLMLIWFFGTLLVLAHLAMGYLSLWLLHRRCVRLTNGDWDALMNRLRRELQVITPVELLSSPLRTMPMTWGLWRTCLLLPQQADTWPHEQRRSVLLHELGHVRRRDCLAQLLAQIACALYWFNPLAWIGWHRMQVERERACDDLVLNTGAKASVYAQHLLDSAAALRCVRFVGAAVAMARPSTLEERLRAILDGRRNRSNPGIESIAATVLLLAAALVPVAALRAQQTPTAEPAPSNLPVTTQTPPGTTPTPTTRQAGMPPGGRRPAVRSSGGSGGFGAGYGGSGGVMGEVNQPPAATMGEGPTCTFDAMIYRVNLPADQIGRLDIGALTKASITAEDFEKALAAVGSIQPLYRANQSVRLAGDSINIGTQAPYVTNSRLDDEGRVINQVAYSSTGATFSLAGRVAASGKIELDLNLQVSTMTESNTEIGTGVKAPLHRVATMSHKGPVEANRPFVVMSIDAASADASGKAVAYITRITLGPPEGQ